ncbi:MAG TPA: MlaA family lipoprotein, partial [Candidatus Methylomirabilis sp.]|nr:MlaA family lipoprotein [Candidatus Methylomirabilis sp.]
LYATSAQRMGKVEWEKMRIVTKIRVSMWWLMVLMALLVSAGPGVVSLAWAEEGMELLVNVSSGLSEPPSDAVGPDGAPAAMPPEGVAPDREPAEATQGAPQVEPTESEDYDPWGPFNERMFTFNRQLDRYLVKPVATGWDTVVPNPVQRGLGRMFDNAGMPRRFVNNLLQGNPEGAGRELGRLLLNSTIGLAGFFDVAREIGLEPSDKDTGQTLGVWGVGPGPYLVLPFMPPMTVRDGIGSGLDVLLNPVTYFAPFAALLGIKGADTMNSRSLNLEVFEHVEEGTIDMYSAVRNAYLQRRENAVRENRE